MTQQPSSRPYEGYTYPTEFQPIAMGTHDSGASTSFSRARVSPTAAPSLTGATGLVRRTPQPTGVPAASTTSTGVNATGYPTSYGYFHRQSSTIDFNSGYNSDAGSSASNAMYTGGSRSAFPISSSTLQPPEVVVGTSRSPARGSCATSVEIPPGAWAEDSGVEGFIVGDRNSSQMPPRFRGSGAHPASSEGSAGSLANVSGSVPPPAQQTFLSSDALLQSPPLTSQKNIRSNYQQQQQPYAVPVPFPPTSSWQRVAASGMAPPETASPQRSGPYIPTSVNLSSPSMRGAYDPSTSVSATGGGGMSSGQSRSGLFGRLMSQILPALDDNAGSHGSGTGFDGAAPIGERPLHQLRFGNPVDDLPLLEELGIYPRCIVDKARAVLNPFKPVGVDAAKDTDLAGPIIFAFSLASLLSLRGKIQFSATYGLFVVGVGLFKMLLSLMQPNGGVPLQFVISAIGYGLPPTVLLAAVRSLGAWLGISRGVMPLTLLMVAWSAWCGTKLVAKGLGMSEQRYLILYPMFLLYSTFNAMVAF